MDHQAGLISLVQDFSPSEFKNNVLAVAACGKYFKLPTILTTSFESGPNGPLVPELKEMFKQLIIAGVVTEVCVRFPPLRRDTTFS